MRAFAYVIAHRWAIFLVAVAILTIVGITAWSVGHWGPMIAALAAISVALPLRLIRTVRLIDRFGSAGWEREIWGPDLEDYPALAAPFNARQTSSTMLRSAATLSELGVPAARYERFDVVGFFPLIGRGTHVELMHLDHDMPTVQFWRQRPHLVGPDGMGPSASGDGLTYVGANVGVQGDELLVSRWMTENAVVTLAELLELVPRVTLSGSTLFAYGHIARDGEHWDSHILALLTRLSLELGPALRREHGFPVESNAAVALPVTGKRGSRTFVWAALLTNLVFPPMGAVLSVGAVGASSERSGKWRLAAWGVLLMSLVQIAGMAALIVYVESSPAGGSKTEAPLEVKTEFDEPGDTEPGDTAPENDFPWDKEQRNHLHDLDDAVSGIADVMEGFPGPPEFPGQNPTPEPTAEISRTPTPIP